MTRLNMRDPRHLMRFIRAEGMSGTEAEKVAAIAKAEGVTPKTVRESIQAVYRYRAQNSTLELDLAIRDLAISAVPKAKETLVGLLSAMEMVEFTDEKTGKKKVKVVEDKTTRLEAMRVMNQLISNLQPKGPAIEVNNNNLTQNNVTPLSSAETMEERLRRLRGQAQAHNALPAEVVAVPEYVDAGRDSDDDLDEEEEEEDGDVD